MPVMKFIDGNTAAAYGVKLSRPQVICAYPITPQTPIVEHLAEFIAQGELSAKYLAIEGEHSALAASVASVAAGARTFTATSSQGLAYMHECLYFASGYRLPLVMVVVNRSLGAPWTILAGHDDSIAQRDSGWIQIYCRRGQEILDSIVQAYRIAEDRRVLVPVMVCFEGFVVSHCYEEVSIPDQEDVDSFLPPYEPPYRLDVENPLVVTTFSPAVWWLGFKKLHEEAIEEAKRVIVEVDHAYAKAFGRSCGGLFEAYQCEDAEAVLLTMGSTALTAKMVVDRLRREGVKVGLVSLRVFRPFPRRELVETLRNVEAIGVLERNCSLGGGGGAVYTELRSAFYSAEVKPKILNFIGGMGGKDITPGDIEKVLGKTLQAARVKAPVEREVEWLI